LIFYNFIELDGDGDGDDGDGDGGDYDDMDENKRALNLAADHMEDPEVQENMQRLLDDPDNLEDNIENDDELRALRDSNPLCEELMQDPETMKVLVDPDNLRALGECPDLIDADFMDPDGFVPDDVEMQNMEGMEGGYDNWDGTGGDFDDFEIDVDDDVEMENDNDFDGGDDDADADGDDDGDGGDEEEEEEENWFDDAELEEQENDNGQQSRGRGQPKPKPKAQARGNQPNQPPAGNSRFGGIMATIGAAATDLIAASIVGSVMGDIDLAEMGGGGGDDLGGDDVGGDAIGDGMLPLLISMFMTSPSKVPHLFRVFCTSIQTLEKLPMLLERLWMTISMMLLKKPWMRPMSRRRRPMRRRRARVAPMPTPIRRTARKVRLQELPVVPWQEVAQLRVIKKTRNLAILKKAKPKKRTKNQRRKKRKKRRGDSVDSLTRPRSWLRPQLLLPRRPLLLRFLEMVSSLNRS
jgi:hypothetical protein